MDILKKDRFRELVLCMYDFDSWIDMLANQGIEITGKSTPQFMYDTIKGIVYEYAQELCGDSGIELMDLFCYETCYGIKCPITILASSMRGTQLFVLRSIDNLYDALNASDLGYIVVDTKKDEFKVWK